MRFQQVLDKRHSVRSYEKKRVPKSVLKQLIKDASKAPSASNSQPWYFYILSGKKRDKFAKMLSKVLVTHKKHIDKMPSKLRKAAYNFYSNMGGCPHVILAYSDKVKKKDRDNKLLSVAAAMQNLCLSAVNKGLGTCWLGSVKGDETKLRKIIKTPKNKELVVGMLVGYSKKGFKPLKRTKKRLNQIFKFI